MLAVEAVTLARAPVRLVPLGLEHEAGLATAAADGELWKLRVTSVPEPSGQHSTRNYIEAALRMRSEGHRFAFAVLDHTTGQVIGSTSYHDIDPSVDRLEIGHTWYAKSRQRSSVNTTTKLMLLTHAFESLGAHLVGLRTDNFNFASQRAIERLGARKDGVIRHHRARADGTVRDTVLYSISVSEWPEVRAHLEYQITRPRP
jgi:N-acetyltransferase